MNRQEGEKQITRLIEKYENLTLAQRKQYNEANTRKNFILPLFEILGWDTRSEDVPEEERASGKRVDYAFKINGITKFFLEAKPFSINLDESRWAEQAIWYAYHKSVPWVILTDFESIKVFNTEWDEQDAERSLVFEISYKDYLTSDKLWFLSRLSIEKGELDEYAEKEFKKPKRVAVDKQLVADLLRWRDGLYADFSGYNPLIDKKKIAENVQKVLNRIIFIRTCEDRGFEEKSLQEMVRNWEEGRGKSDELVNGLRVLFKEFDKNYDSKLFEEKILFESEKFVVDDNILAEVIKETYKGSKGIRWNFNDISNDILGSIYEQYLGQIQQEDGKEKRSSKRKSQGIYYTPRYIVDYIVENTLGEILKNKIFHEALKIKVLDPACGSGSFLIKAFEVFDNHLRKISGKMPNFARSLTVLTSNIYGVDLDQEAVEIAQLNLLLKVLNRRERLPNLSNNIECGNSLISGTEEELKKYFGKNWEDKRPFNWQEKFPDVFKQGGFDVIIGNPPYISNKELFTDDKKYFNDKYETAFKQYDILILFFERALRLLKNGGILGFIVSNKFLASDYGLKLRKLLLENFIIKQIIDVSHLPVFSGASVYPIIIILEKHKLSKYNIKLCKIIKENEIKKIDQFCQSVSKDVYEKQENNIFITDLNIGSLKLLDKIKENSIPLGGEDGVCKIMCGIASTKIGGKITQHRTKEDDFIVLEVSNVDRYFIQINNKYISKDNLSNKRLIEDFNKKKILIGGMGKYLRAVIDDFGYALGRIYYITQSDCDLRYLLTLLNSKVLDYYFKKIYGSVHLAGGFLRFNSTYLNTLPIHKVDFSNKTEKQKHDELVKLADKMLKLNKELQKLGPILDEDEYKELKSEIQKTDKEIDERVYKLYGLTPEEIKIVEDKN